MRERALVWKPRGAIPTNDYAALVIGPDGHDLEAVCHAPEE
jgi:hypothetical protein